MGKKCVEMLQVVELGESHLKCGAHNLMTEMTQSVGNTTEEREREHT